MYLRLAAALNLELNCQVAANSPVATVHSDKSWSCVCIDHNYDGIVSIPTATYGEKCPTTSMAFSRGAVTWHTIADIVSTYLISILRLFINSYTE